MPDSVESRWSSTGPRPAEGPEVRGARRTASDPRSRWTSRTRRVRTQRPAAMRCLHAIDARRLRESRSWVVSFLISGPFGPRRSAQAEDALQVSAEYIAQRCDPVEESEVDRLRRELAEALQEEDEEPPENDVTDDIEDWAKRVSRFVGVAWDEKRRKWKVTLNELDGKD